MKIEVLPIHFKGAFVGFIKWKLLKDLFFKKKKKICSSDHLRVPFPERPILYNDFFQKLRQIST